MAVFHVYTREIEGYKYPSGLAQSVHFAVTVGGERILIKNGYGILYPRAEIGDCNEILERGIKSPSVVYENGKYHIAGKYVDRHGCEVYPDKLYAWESTDLMTFDELGLVELGSVPYSENTEVAITTETACRLIDKYSVPEIIHTEIKGDISVHTYSDGSVSVEKYPKTEYPAPAYESFADPVIFDYNGKKYFIGTNVKTDCVGLYLAEGDNIVDLFDSPELHCILPYNEELNFCSTFWAPEFHKIGDDYYILFAVGKGFSPQSHVMKLKRGGDILSPDGWETPLRVKRKNGEFLVTRREDFTLDMTYIHANGRHYYAWSERYGLPKDSGSMIYIGEFDPARADILISDPVLLTRPLYGWENQSGTVNNEGPYPLYHDGKIYLTYSAAAAGSFSYTVSYLYADENADLLDPKSWTKLKTPIFSAYDLDGIEGPGHGAFATGDDGELIYVHHAQPLDVHHRRLTYISRVHFDRDGAPRLYTKN